MKLKSRLKTASANRRWLIIALSFIGLTIYLRFWHLTQIPPGTHILEAELGLKALATKLLPPLKDSQQLLTIWAAKLAFHVEHNRLLGLRLVAAKFSLLGVVFFYLWIKQLFGSRTALFGIVLAAITPWALHLGRFGAGYSLALAFMAASLCLITWAWHRPSMPKIVLALAVTALGLYSHPIYNWYLLALVIAGLMVAPRFLLEKRRGHSHNYAIGGLVLLLLAAPAAPAVLSYIGSNFKQPVAQLTRQLVPVLSMFNLHTPQGFEFNLATLPLLNAFTGLMLVLGILASIGQIKLRNHRVVLWLFLVALIPALVLPASANLADRTATLLWPSLALSAIGIEYLLTQWLRTFPQNSAARQIGMLMLGVLLVLSARQGYNQYFLAWPASTETKLAYHYPTIQATNFANSDQFAGEKYLVGNQTEFKIIQFMKADNFSVRLIEPAAIKTMPKSKASRQFILLEDNKDEALKLIGKRFPGGKLVPSIHGGQELFLVYTAKPS